MWARSGQPAVVRATVTVTAPSGVIATSLTIPRVTMSAPNSSGRVSTGDANVLSTPSSAPPACAISAQAAMSVIVIRGLPGLSIHTNLVAGAFITLINIESA